MSSIFIELQSKVKQEIEVGAYAAALEDIKQFIVTVMNMEATPGEVVGARKIDELCENIGNSYFRRYFHSRFIDKPYKPDDNRVVIVCTGLYKYGGTSLVISDLVKAQDNHECTVIATNYLNDMTPEDLELSRIGGSGATVSICPPGDAKEKLHWLIKQFVDISPSRIFLLNHHQDSVMISGVSPFVDKAKVIFYHHADYNICLGVHLKGAIHVDPHNVGFHNCRMKENISDNAYLPLNVDDCGLTRVGAEFIRTGELTTCSSGHYLKFRNFYLYPYAELMVERLKVRSGTHIHIGALPASDLAQIRKKLTDNRIDVERFVHVPWTASLWRTLVDKNVDLFIASFPIGGARTTIEVMGAGIPILAPQNYLSRFFSSRDILYANVLLWKYPHDFIEAIIGLSSESLAAQAVSSRAHYVQHYSSETVDLKGRIDAICSGKPAPAPPDLYPHLPDLLDRVLHFGHLDTLTSGYAVQKALDSLPLPPIQQPRQEKQRPKSGVVGVFLDLFNKAVGKQAIDVAKDLSPEDRKLYLALKRKPDSIGFDPSTYLRRNPDVARAGVDPLVHFIEFGQLEGRSSSFFLEPDWHFDMNEKKGRNINKLLHHLTETRSQKNKLKVAVFAYAWNPSSRLDAYIRESVAALAHLGLNVDVYIGGQFSENRGTKGFRSDLKSSDMGAFVRSQCYDFAISFNNALIIPETVEALDCTIVSVLVDSIHHFFDHTGDGPWKMFSFPIHAAPIYTSFIEDLKNAPNVRASASFLPAATIIESHEIDAKAERREISWIASMLGDYHFDNFLSRIDSEVENGFDLMSRCLMDIEKYGKIDPGYKSQEAVKILAEWAQWDYHTLEMHLQEVVSNQMRLAVVERLAPYGLQIFGNARWRTALPLSQALVRSFRPASGLLRHADLRTIYDSSKISINLPQVHAGTGMQYRIIDILASKSLLITKQVEGSDMERVFGSDSPIVTFTDLDDLEAKCAYFLKNEVERQARVDQCNALVARGFSFRDRALEYLQISNSKKARNIFSGTGSGSVALIPPERVIDWAEHHKFRAA